MMPSSTTTTTGRQSAKITMSIPRKDSLISVFSIVTYLFIVRFLLSGKPQIGFFQIIIRALVNCLLNGSCENEISVLQNGDCIAQDFHLVHKMRGKKDGQTLLFQCIQTFPNTPARFCIKTRCKLVQKDDLRIGQER